MYSFHQAKSETPVIVELKNQPSVEVKDKSPGLGIALVDHGPDHELVMVVLLKTGQVVAEKLGELTGIGLVTGNPAARDATYSNGRTC